MSNRNTLPAERYKLTRPVLQPAKSEESRQKIFARPLTSCSRYIGNDAFMMIHMALFVQRNPKVSFLIGIPFCQMNARDI